MENKLILPKWAKSVTIITTSLMTLSAGTLYGFSGYSKDLVAALGQTGDLDILGSFGDAGIYAGITMGFLTDKCGPLATLLVSAALTFIGYFTVWLAVSGTVVLGIPTLATAFFLAGQGSFGFYFISLYLNGKLVGPETRAAMYGYVLMLFGFSSLLYLSIFTELINSQVDDFFLVLAISLPASGLLTAFGQFMIHACGTAPPEDKTRLYPNGASCYDDPNGIAAVRDIDDELAPSIEADIDLGRPLIPPKKGRSITGIVELIRCPLFWCMFFFFISMTGPGLMWKNKVGTVVLTYADGLVSTDALVKSWAIINSVSRVIFGTLASVASARWNMPKSVLLIFAAVVMAGSQLFYSIVAFADDYELADVALWIANIGTAVAYGCQFTIVTSLCGEYFGSEGLGRNLGALTLAPMIGGTALTAVVNSLKESHFASGFLCSASTVGIALVCSIILLRNDILESRAAASTDG